MVYLITGDKGKGKTSYLLEAANQAMQDAKGNVVYVDKSSKHMYELNNRIRLIDISKFPVKNKDQFTGFICGILSQDHDIEKMYLDNFLKIASLENDFEAAEKTIEELEEISRIFDVEFITAFTADKEELGASLQARVSKAL